MKDTILVIQNLSPKQFDDLKEQATNYKVVQSLKKVNPKSVKIILGWDAKLTPLIENNELEVKWIQYTSAGVEHLPLSLFKKKNIRLTNGSGTNAHAVAETAMGLILSITRNIIKASKNQEKEIWDAHNERYELNEKTLLIVGAGEIGEQLGRVAKAFDMKTIGINRSGDTIQHMDEQYIQDDVTQIIQQADIVVNILPATTETDGFFDKTLFSQMKPETIFVNVGRGETVVTADLIEALNTGQIRWAALDVFENEPLPAGHPLWSHPDVLMTPHIAGQVENKSRYIYPIFLENFQAFEKGQELPRNLVQLDTGY